MESEDLDPLVGRTLAGKYRLERMLARGTMGRVYYGVQEPLGRPVAVKVLSVIRALHRDAEEIFEQRFYREARALAALESPHIVQLYDYGEEDGLYYLVMEYVAGTSLHDLVHAGPVAPEEAERIVRQVLSALHVAHGQGIVHRDLKPPNIVLRGTDQVVKILDFGLAKMEGEITELSTTGVVIGTPWYISPEGALGEPVDGRADLYAAGMLLYRMVTGTVPYANVEGGKEVLLAHVSQSPRRFRVANPELRVPGRLERVALTCLRKDPDKRYQTAAEVLQALEGGEPIPRVLVGVTAAVLVVGLLVAAAGLGWFSPSSEGVPPAEVSETLDEPELGPPPQGLEANPVDDTPDGSSVATQPAPDPVQSAPTLEPPAAVERRDPPAPVPAQPSAGAPQPDAPAADAIPEPEDDEPERWEMNETKDPFADPEE